MFINYMTQDPRVHSKSGPSANLQGFKFHNSLSVLCQESVQEIITMDTIYESRKMLQSNPRQVVPFMYSTCSNSVRVELDQWCF